MKSRFLFKLIFFAFLLPLAMHSQTINGIVYGSKASLENIKVANTTKKIQTYTDKDGRFSIRASVNDTLVLTSLFYEEQTEIVTNTSFEDRSEEHTSELQSRENLVCRLLLEKKK